MIRKRIVLVIGTRPEAIKLAPVFEAAQKARSFDVRIVSTGQHRDLLKSAFSEFELPIDFDLSVMQPDQSLSQTVVAIVAGLDAVLRSVQPHCVVVQGDTSTAFGAALAAFHLRIPVAHVEAGLRTHDLGQPFPEEAYRNLIARIASFHFAPTARAERNLLAEGVPANRIWVTGNTAIDALYGALGGFDSPTLNSRLELGAKGKLLLLTAHRRENHGAALVEICGAVLDLLAKFDDLRVLCPVHPNPEVSAVVRAQFAHDPRVHVVEAMGYMNFVMAMADSRLILSDSGGVQEEAPSLGKPVLVLRNVTERTEGSDAGSSVIVGTDRKRIVREVSRLLESEADYQAMSRRDRSPYGDGKAAFRILEILRRKLCGGN